MATLLDEFLELDSQPEITGVETPETAGTGSLLQDFIDLDASSPETPFLPLEEEELAARGLLPLEADENLGALMLDSLRGNQNAAQQRAALESIGFGVARDPQPGDANYGVPPPLAMEDVSSNQPSVEDVVMGLPTYDQEFSMGRSVENFTKNTKTGFLNALVEAQVRTFGKWLRDVGAEPRAHFETFMDAMSPSSLTGVGALVNPSLYRMFRSNFSELDERMRGMGSAIDSDAKLRQDERQAEINNLLGPDPSLLDEVLASSGYSLGMSTGAVAAGLLTRGRSVAAATGAMGYFTYANSRLDALDRGLSEERAHVYGMIDGMIEAGTEFTPMKALFEVPGFKKKLASFLIRESIGENLATFLQDVNEVMTFHPDMTGKEFLNKWAHDALITTLSVPITGGVQVAGVSSVEKGIELWKSRKRIGGAGVLTENEESAENSSEEVGEIAPETQALVEEIQGQLGGQLSRATWEPWASAWEIKENGPFEQGPVANLDLTFEALAKFEARTVERAYEEADMEARGIEFESVFSPPPGLNIADPEARRIYEKSKRDAFLSDHEAIKNTTLDLMDNPPSETMADVLSNIQDAADSAGAGQGLDLVDIVQDKLDRSETLRPDLDVWNRLLDLTYTLIEVGKHNPHIGPIQNYIGTAETGKASVVRGWWRTKTEQVAHANETLREWRKVVGFWGGKALESMDALFLEADVLSEELGRKLTPEEIQNIIRKNNLNISDQELQLVERVWQDYRDSINLIREELIKEIQRVTLKDDITEAGYMDYVREIEEVNKQFDAMVDRNYLPHTRFGRYQTYITAKEDITFLGKEFKRGDTIFNEHYESKGTRRRDLPKFTKLVKDNGLEGKVTIVRNQVTTDKVRMLQGLPPIVARNLANRLNLNEDQKNELTTMLKEQAPANSFRKRMLERSGIKGYSRNSRRAYADYFQRFSNHYARLKHNWELDAALQSMQDGIKALEVAKGLNSVEVDKRTKLHAWMVEHKEYLNNPGPEWSNLRAFGFMYYLGFMPKAAFVNLTQVPFFSYPHLAADYGDAAAVRELSAAMSRNVKFWRDGKQYDPETARMIQEGILRGILEESQATELGAVQEGAQIARFTSGKVVGSETIAQTLRDISTVGSWLFSRMEKFNRVITADATFQLARKAGDSFEVAQEKALAAVENTQYEYGRWNRPAFMRGRRSAFFLFYQYLNQTMFFIGAYPGSKGEQGRWKMLALLFAATGAGGLPFFEDATDVIDAAVTYTMRKAGIEKKYSTEALLKEAVDYLNDGMGNWEVLFPDGDTFYHGLAHNFGGTGTVDSLMGTNIGFKGFDIAPSLGLGDLIPMTEIPGALLGGSRNPEVSLNRGLAQAAGAIASIPYQFYLAAASNEIDPFKKWERVYPSFARSINRAVRFATQGGETDRLGNFVAEVDPTSFSGMLEIGGQAVGFNPTRVQTAKYSRFRAREVVQFWEARKRAIYELYDYGLRNGNSEYVDYARERLKIYNRDVPYPEMAIGFSTLYESLRSRARSRGMTEIDMHQSKSYRRLYREQIDIYGGR